VLRLGNVGDRSPEQDSLDLPAQRSGPRAPAGAIPDRLALEPLIFPRRSALIRIVPCFRSRVITVEGLGFALVRCSFRVCGQRHRNRQRSYAGSIVVLLKWSRKMFRGMRFLQVSERRPCLRIAFNSVEFFCDRRQGHGKFVDDCKEIPFKEADCNQ